MSILEKQINLRQVASDTFAASWHEDWAVGPTLLGSCVAAVVHHAAATYLRTDPKLVKLDQPDVLNLHLEFLRICTHDDSIIKVTPLKTGATISTLQLQLFQDDQVKVFAIAISTNFDRSLGPTAAAPESWSLHPPPKPKPDFDRVLAHKSDPNWVPAAYDGEVLPMTGRLLVLDPRGGFPDNGICDAWNGFLGNERMDATYLAMMTDIMPSMSDTLLRNGGAYDAHVFQEKAERWADKNPGVPLVMKSNTIAEVMKISTVNNTATLDIEYKRRLPKEGLRFTFTRTTSKMLCDGRMDVDLTMYNEDMELVCLARQLILVLDIQRKFGSGKPEVESRL